MKRRAVTRLMRTASQSHALLYRLSRGRLGGRIVGMPVLLLTTTGRRTGRRRTTPLSYLRDGDDYVLTASNGGNHWFPAWWMNLKVRPSAVVQVGPQKLRVSAREAAPEEAYRLWPKFVEGYKGYGDYANRTSRKIPVVILTPEL